MVEARQCSPWLISITNRDGLRGDSTVQRTSRRLHVSKSDPASLLAMGPLLCSHLPSAPPQAALRLPFSSINSQRLPSNELASSDFPRERRFRVGILRVEWTTVSSPTLEFRAVFGDSRVERRRGVAERKVLFAGKSSSVEEEKVTRIHVDVNGAGLFPCRVEEDETIIGGGSTGIVPAGQVVDESFGAAGNALEDSREMDSSSGSPQLISKEVARRRNFAIISHPDAGKTTLVDPCVETHLAISALDKI